MALSELNLTTNKNLVSLQSETLRQSESGLVLKANLLMPDGSPYDLSDKNVIFNEHKTNDKYIVDTNVKPVDEAHGSISYQLHPQTYAASGIAWFEIQDKSGNVVDSTQDFYLNVKDAANASVYNSNYIYKLDSLRNQLQQIVDSADGELKAELQKMADGLTQKLNDMQTAYNASDKQWQDTFKQSEQSRADDYTAEKNKRLADDQANAKAFKDAQDQRDTDYQADKDKRSSDFASQQDTINAAAKTQRDTISQQWTSKQSALVEDWTAKRETLDAEVNKLETTVNDLQTAVDQLNKTDLPNAQSKMDALNDEIKKAEQTFSEVDFSKFVTGDQLKQVTDTLATKVDKAEVDTKLLADYYDKTTTDSKLADKANAADVYTKTELDPKLAEAGKVKTVSLNGGNKVAPDNGGNIDLTVPQPDLTGYAKASDVSAVKATAAAARSVADANAQKIDSINASISQLPVVKHFSNAADAQTFSNANPTAICLVDG